MTMLVPTQHESVRFPESSEHEPSAVAVKTTGSEPNWASAGWAKQTCTSTSTRATKYAVITQSQIGLPFHKVSSTDFGVCRAVPQPNKGCTIENPYHTYRTDVIVKRYQYHTYSRVVIFKSLFRTDVGHPPMVHCLTQGTAQSSYTL